MSDEVEKWFATEYKELWHRAYNAGVEANKQGKPRVCDLGPPFGHNENVLKVYKSAWEQGWDGYKVPEVFTKMERFLDTLPMKAYDGRS